MRLALPPLVLPTKCSGPSAGGPSSPLCQTSLIACALHRLYGSLFAFSPTVSEEVLEVLAGLELLARLYSNLNVGGGMLPRFIEGIAPRFPSLAAELWSLLEGRKQFLGETQASADEIDDWQMRLQQLNQELEAEVRVHHTRGLALSNRIQVDVLQRTFRPWLDAVFSQDRLDDSVVEAIRECDPDDLFDRHPLNIAATATRRITGAA